MGLTLTAPPVKQPVTSAEVKDWIRMDSGDTSQDSVITTLIAAATRLAERTIMRSLIAQTWTWEMDSDDARASRVYFWMPTVNSITSFKTWSSDGETETTVDSGDYELVEGLFMVRRNDAWEVNRRDRAAQLIYIAGPYTDESDTPDDIKLAILKMVATHYEMRQNSVVGTIVADLTEDAYQLLKPYEYWRP